MAVAAFVAAAVLGLSVMLASIVSIPALTLWGSGCSFDSTKAGSVTVTGRGGGSVELGAGQLQNAATILDVARELELPPTAGKIALMTGLQESTLRMLANTNVPGSLSFPHEGTGSDHDSVNVFQQRPHWGSPAELMDLNYAARAFFGGPSGPNGGSPRGLLDIPGWETKGLGEAAQAVQVSAFPDLYDGWAEAADQIIAAVTGATVCAAKPVGDGSDGRNGWGGYENGRIPVQVLSSIPWSPHHLLRQDATAALTEMNAAWKARFGSDIKVNDAYRDLAGQVDAKAGWCARGRCEMAATPGESNHGWAVAVDIQVGFGDAQYRWLKENASLYGWVHPDWAEPTGGKPEPWHWEFAGR
ncbi:D-alanyl-D-alanine carboxypeptidase family protein [Microbacterium sp. NPDC055988]|uniref:M15 family metallopeptidase n=1 Tax=Microbacterium sp. NPDC055988 TaxID=3345671 RepID=UPI0035D8F29F